MNIQRLRIKFFYFSGCLTICIAAISLTTTSLAGELKTLIESPPSTLNPRMTLDANGQRINMLLFRALTRVDENLIAQPDLAKTWASREAGKSWVFDLVEQDVTAHDLKACFDQYMTGTPASPFRSSFPTWKEVLVLGPHKILVNLTASDPYLPKNLSLFRFFRVEGNPIPCVNPSDQDKVMGGGDYQLVPWSNHPDRVIRLVPKSPNKETLIFEVVKEETSRFLKLVKGDIDFLQNSFSPTKTDWVMKHHGDRFKVIERNGVNVSYLAFNLRDPILSQLKVRQAIALAIDREIIIKNYLKNFGSLAGSFLAPELADSFQATFEYNPQKAQALLDEAGFPMKEGVRFRVKYKTTPSRDGFEVAQVFQDMLKRVGIAIDLEMVEPAVFFASIRKGNFQLYSSRWVGVSDSSILQRTLKSKNPDNRVGYTNEAVDQALETVLSGQDPGLRTRQTQFVQEQMARDLPYFPLWFWSNSIIMKKNLGGLKKEQVSLSGSFLAFPYFTQSLAPSSKE